MCERSGNHVCMASRGLDSVCKNKQGNRHMNASGRARNNFLKNEALCIRLCGVFPKTIGMQPVVSIIHFVIDFVVPEGMNCKRPGGPDLTRIG